MADFFGIITAMNTRRRIPYGVMNYEKLVRECYFVGNTRFIRQLENVDTPVFLRPKRFGKSVWCSLLAHYYDVNLKDRFQELFGATDIGTALPQLASVPSRLGSRRRDSRRRGLREHWLQVVSGRGGG